MSLVRPDELDVKVEGNNIIITAKQEIQEAGGTRHEHYVIIPNQTLKLFNFLQIFLPQGVGFPLYPEIFYNITQ